MWYSRSLKAAVKVGSLIKGANTVKQVQFFSSFTHVSKKANRLLEQQRRIAISSWQYGFYSLQRAEELNNMGLDFYRAGHLTAASKYLQQALKIKLSHYGSDNPDLANTLANFALTCAANKLTDEAIEYYQHALTIKLKLFRANHPEVAKLRNNIGLAYQEQDDLDTAKVYFQQSYNDLSAELGEAHPWTQQVRSNLDRCIGKSAEVKKSING